MLDSLYYYDDSIPVGDALELEYPLFSKREIDNAGKLLRGVIPASDKASPEVLQAFKVAWNWRNSHILPMVRLRRELSAKARVVNPASVSVARPKRMKSIRKKLWSRSLYDIQDLAGCRSIMATLSEVELLLQAYQASARHQFKAQDDYISNPRPTGYRSHHLMFQFVGRDPGEEVFRRQIIEIQLRTQLQHAWATAVEAVGLVRNEDLKGGKGDPEWLRFFALMASDFAAEEDCPLVPGTPQDRKECRDEIVALERKLDAVSHLDSFRQALHLTSRVSASRGSIFVIQYNLLTRSVTVKPVASWRIGEEKTRAAEMRDGNVETVMVEVDRAADLRTAYPNYFLDVGMFAERLRSIVEEPKRPRLASRVAMPDFTSWYAWRRGK